MTFYSQNREQQFIRLEPLQKLIIRNQPCDRLRFAVPENTPIAYYQYTLKIYSAESDQELMVFLSDGVLDIDTESDLSIPYVEARKRVIIPEGSQDFILLEFQNPIAEEVIDNIIVMGNNITSDITVSKAPILFDFFEQILPTQTRVRSYGVLATSPFVPGAKLDQIITLEETSTNSTVLACEVTKAPNTESRFPLYITYRLRSLRANPAIVAPQQIP